MNKENLVATLKEKGPALLIGMMLGATLLAAYLNRDRIAKAVDQTLGKNKQDVIRNEYPTRD